MSGYPQNTSVEESRNLTKVTIDHLPSEAVLHIFSYLNASDLSCCLKTCRRWAYLIEESETLWKLQCLSLTECKPQVQIDRLGGFTWKETFQLNFGRNGIKRLWRQGLFSNPTSLKDLPDKQFVSLDTDSWGEILQWELDRT